MHYPKFKLVLIGFAILLSVLLPAGIVSAHGHPHSSGPSFVFPFPNEGINTCGNIGTAVTFCQIDGQSFGVVSSIDGWATANGNTVTVNNNTGDITVIYSNLDWSFQLQNDRVLTGDQIGTATNLTVTVFSYRQQLSPSFNGYVYSLSYYRGGFASDQTRSNGVSDTDLGTYCVSWLGPRYKHQAKNDTNTPTGWYCVLLNGQKGPYIVFPDACVWAFGSDSVSITDNSGPFRQRCYGPTPVN